jgi:hypothetical protein
MEPIALLSQPASVGCAKEHTSTQRAAGFAGRAVLARPQEYLRREVGFARSRREPTVSVHIRGGLIWLYPVAGTSPLSELHCMSGTAYPFTMSIER